MRWWSPGLGRARSALVPNRGRTIFYFILNNLEKTANTQFCPSAASGLQQSYVSRSATLLSNGCITRVAPLPLHRLPEPVRSPHHLASSPVATCSGDECKLLEDLAIHSLCFFCRCLLHSSFSPHLPRILPAPIRQLGCANALICLAPTLITISSPRPLYTAPPRSIPLGTP